MNRLVFAFIFVIGALLGRPVSAASIEAYSAEIDLRDPDVTRYTLRLDYKKDSPYERKDRGFKFVGEGAIGNVQLLDSPGAKIGLARGYDEQRIEFTLPPDAAGDPAPIGFSFERDTLSGARDWNSTDYDIPWLSRFGVDVGPTSVVVLAPPDWSITGLPCERLGDHQRCTRTTDAPALVMFTASRPNDFAWSLSGVVLSALLLLTGFVFGGRWARKVWILSLGVLPVVQQTPEPQFPQGYRAPAPLPVETELEPVLSNEDGRLLTTRLLQAFGISAAGLVALVLVVPGRVATPPGAWFVTYALVASVASAFAASRLERWMWLPALIVAASLLHPLLDLAGFEPDGDLVVFSPLLVLIPLFVAKFGSGSGGTTDGVNSSFFSCSGGGCGGGGGGCGGGGCGGCGG